MIVKKELHLSLTSRSSNGSFLIAHPLITPEAILKKYWGHDHFRLLQREIIQAVLNKEDVLALLPTGGGKSVCFQVPGLIMEGLTVVISPLIALMQDQVQRLKEMKIQAIAVHSGMGRQEMDIALDNCIYGKIKFLYLSPERLQTEIFRERFRRMNVSLIAIDEAHCISQWGYDFRPAYLQIAKLREDKPGVPFLALTATATRHVKEDIVLHLQLRNPTLLQKSFLRDNLSFVVRKTEAKEKKLMEILRNVPGSTIIYVRSRKATQDFSRWLERQNISSTYYHAGLNHVERMQRQEAWINDTRRVMVATNAFGMGIDKSNVRSVIHLDLPENLEAYYQEAGRAGRDGKHSFAAVVYHQADVDALRSKVQQSYPPLEYLKKTYQALANYFQLAQGSGEGESFDFDLDEFSRRFNLRSSMAFASLKKMEEEGLILLSESFYRPSRVHLQIDKTKLYEFQVAHAKFDPLIKAMLRMYGAELFSEFVTVSESNIARTLKASDVDVRQQLDQMSKLLILNYEPASDKPQITFVIPRQDADRLPVNHARLKERRELAISKSEAVIQFAEQSLRCRMQVILEYFDETTDQNCGKCDVCIGRKKSDQAVSFESYQKQIDVLLSDKAMTVDELESAANPQDHDLFIEVVREMVDMNKIYYDDYWVLRKKVQ